MGFWGLPVKYGIGRAITGEEKLTTFTEGASELAAAKGWTEEPLVPRKDKAFYDKMSKKERAVYLLKRKLIHGAEGTVLIAGLTKAIGLTGKALWGTGRAIGSTVTGPFNTYVLNPVSSVMKSRKTGLPQLVKGIRNAGGFIGGTVLRIPPYKNWGFFSTTMGPWKERFFASLETKVLPPLRVRGSWTKEAKQIELEAIQKWRALKKDVGLSLSRIDRSIYGILNKGFTHRAFTTSSVGAGKLVLG